MGSPVVGTWPGVLVDACGTGDAGFGSAVFVGAAASGVGGDGGRQAERARMRSEERNSDLVFMWYIGVGCLSSDLSTHFSSSRASSSKTLFKSPVQSKNGKMTRSPSGHNVTRPLSLRLRGVSFLSCAREGFNGVLLQFASLASLRRHAHFFRDGSFRFIDLTTFCRRRKLASGT